MALDLTGISNQNDYYSQHYLLALLEGDLKALASQWNQRAQEHPGSETHRTTPQRLIALATPYFRALDRTNRLKEPAARLEEQSRWLSNFFTALGYTPAREWRTLPNGNLRIPLLAEVAKPNGAPLLWILQALPPQEELEDDPLTLPVDPAQYEGDPEKDNPQSHATRPEQDVPWEHIITRNIFTQDEPPRWVLLASFGHIYLIDRTKWPDRRYLAFDLKEILSRKDAGTLLTTAALLHRESICPAEGFALLDTLDDNSHRHAFSVSEDLKHAIRECVELLGNEAIHYLRNVSKDAIFSTPDQQLEDRLTRGCLRYLYRLLFIFYLEARPELGYLPIKSDEYLKGYSLEALRDLEMAALETDRDRNGYYFDTSIRILFRLIFEGRKDEEQMALGTAPSIRDDFRITPLKSHLFDPKNVPLTGKVYFDAVKFRNHILQQVIQRLSVGKQGTGRNARTGRISYAQLGINQLGSVYENLLSYSGFFAKTDLYEVKPAGEEYTPLIHAYFVTETELEQYKEANDTRSELDAERVYLPKDPNDPESHRRLKKYAKGEFVYRLAGRAREKTASYYTPESLTQCLVKYALKELLKNKTADDILRLTVCEMAVGSAAFLNEAVNQLAETYLRLKQKETGQTIPHDAYAREKQRVKMRLADNNVFGVDLNPTAVELAEISLWLNTIFTRDDGTPHIPWFGLQLANGNSLIGARRQTFSADLLAERPGRGGDKPRWPETVPDRVPWSPTPDGDTDPDTLPPRPRNSVYHWLVPDPAMSVYSDKVVKQLKSDEIIAINIWRRNFCKAFSSSDLNTLKTLSDAADKLWTRHLNASTKLRADTTDPLPVWPEPESKKAPTSTQWKDEAWAKHILHPFSPYRRLKLAMDYWCALWFWPIEHAGNLPNRDEFLMEMSIILGATPPASETLKQGEFSELLVEIGGIPQAVQPDLDLDDPSGVVNVETLCRKLPRLALVQHIADRRKFFHWELEYVDLFARRGGFDLIAGNPPWIKVEWNEGGLLSEHNPAFAIRKLSASAIANLRDEQFQRPAILADYLAEYEDFEGTQNFLNAAQNYPLLAGQKANLYKCFITRAWELGNNAGTTGFLHPEGVYDDPNGGVLRRKLYPRLRSHFQFENQLLLFSEVHHNTKFSINIYHETQRDPDFDHLANLFVPTTVDACMEHSGQGLITGIKDDENKWATNGHRDRIIRVNEATLALFAQLYDAAGTPALEARLPALHARPLVEVLRKFSTYPTRLVDLGADYFATQHWNEVLQQQDGTMRRETRFVHEPRELILSGPHFFVGNPLNKTPREICALNSDYDCLDLEFLPDDYLPRTNYVPACDAAEYLRRTPIVPWDEHKPVTDFYRYVSREMLSQSGERTLIPVIIPPGVGHIHTCISIAFRDSKHLLSLVGGGISLPIDFWIKTTGAGHANSTALGQLPMLTFSPQMLARTLFLNSLTSYYADLWGECWQNDFRKGVWFGDDPRLDPDFWKNLTPKWQRNCALRTDFMRRWALVELDVLVARELKLTLEELKTIYRIQFPVLRQYEADTWYDQKGRIIFTNSKGLPGVGLTRPEWNEVKDLTTGTVTRTITDNTLPTGPIEREITWHAPFTRSDRERDYETIWHTLDTLT